MKLFKVIGKILNRYKGTFYVYNNKKNDWRWRLVATNNEILCSSSESFKSKVSCLKNIKLLKKSYCKVKSPGAESQQCPGALV